MNKSATIGKIAEALVGFQYQVDAVKKDATNPFFHSKYSNLSTIIAAIKKPLFDNELSYAQFPSGEHQMTTILMHKSGEWIEDTFTMKPVDERPQSLGSTITYMRRYALGAVLGIATEEDDDGNAASKPEQEPFRSAAPTKIDPKIVVQKEKLKKLCDDLSAGLLVGKEAYEKFVNKETGLMLVEDNYKEIIGKLEILKEEKEAK